MFTLQIPFGFPEGATLLILLFVLVIWCIALVTLANSRFNDTATKLCWFLIVLFLNLIGVLLFIIWGRKEIYQVQQPKPKAT
ncbi:MAG: PLD nuclease N-terminal domain-containing protein [Lacibacter sp.]